MLVDHPQTHRERPGLLREAEPCGRSIGGSSLGWGDTENKGARCVGKKALHMSIIAGCSMQSKIYERA